MTRQNEKKIGQRPTIKPITKTDMLHDTWTVMKPFVKFSIGTMKLLAHALIYIVKSIPKPEEHKPVSKGEGKVIKIS